jgi:hypothetical protein
MSRLRALAVFILMISSTLSGVLKFARLLDLENAIRLGVLPSRAPLCFN